MSTISPTRNPSTPGARWIFWQREYLRRVGKNAQTLHRFDTLKRTLESECDADLKLRLKSLQLQRLKSPSKREAELLTADILVIEGEFGYRRSLFYDGPKRKIDEEYKTQVMIRTIALLLREEGEEYLRAILLRAAREVAPHHFKEGTDIEILVEGIVQDRKSGEKKR